MLERDACCVQQEETEDSLRNKLKGKQLFACRYCQGDHLTQKCPFKDVAEALLSALGPEAPQTGGARSAAAAPGQTGGTGTYVPRAVAAASGGGSGGMDSASRGGMSYAGAAKSSSGAASGAYKPPSLLSSDSAGYRGDGRSRTGAHNLVTDY